MLGHEVVEDADGRRVVLVHHLPCAECERCRAGHETTCERFPEPTIVPGGFAERALAAETVALPDGIDDAIGTFAEPLACVLRAVERIPAGASSWSAAASPGGSSSCRRSSGVVTTCSPPTRSRTGSSSPWATAPSLPTRPADAAVLCAHAGLGAALESLEPGGTLLLFSWLTDAPPLDFEQILRRELTLVGSCSATPAAMRKAVGLLPGLGPIPTVTLPLERFAEGLDLYRHHEAVKVVFTPSATA